MEKQSFPPGTAWWHVERLQQQLEEEQTNRVDAIQHYTKSREELAEVNNQNQTLEQQLKVREQEYQHNVSVLQQQVKKLQAQLQEQKAWRSKEIARERDNCGATCLIS